LKPEKISNQITANSNYLNKIATLAISKSIYFLLILFSDASNPIPHPIQIFHSIAYSKEQGRNPDKHLEPALIRTYH
jgi:hypothetical protein